MKNNRTVDVMIYLLIFVVIAVSIVLICFTRTDHTLIYVIGGAALVILIGILIYKNYKSNAYGGKFSQRYPDAR